MFFESIGLSGFSSWLQNHYKEELGHATRLMDYLLFRGASVHLQDVSIDPEIKNQEDVSQIFTTLLSLETTSTAAFQRLTEKALELKDYETSVFLQKFLEIQLLEEYTVNRLVKRIHFAKENPSALLRIDHELKNQ